jgi:hypothetical protein
MIALAPTSRRLLAYRFDVLSRWCRAAARWCCAAALERLDRNDASDAADANACRALATSVDTGDGPGAEGGTRNGHGRTFKLSVPPERLLKAWQREVVTALPP